MLLKLYLTKKLPKALTKTKKCLISKPNWLKKPTCGKTNTAHENQDTLTEFTPVTSGTSITKHTMTKTIHRLKLFKVTSKCAAQVMDNGIYACILIEFLFRFNIFYPDLIDKSSAPTYFIEKDPGTNETVTIRFHAGPPYEDVAFRIVNREWEYSHKKGFKSAFDRGILSLHFHFKREFYRK